MARGLDFAGLGDQLWMQARNLLPLWLSNGKWDGQEFCVGNIYNQKGQSLRINPTKRIWTDFSGGVGGHKVGGTDLISLYAAIHNISMGDAFKTLAGDAGFKVSNSAPPVPMPPKPEIPEFGWAPPGSQLPEGYHHKFGYPSAIYEYLAPEGHPIFLVTRFDPNGRVGDRKQFIPWAWNLKFKTWMQRQIPDSRPLFGLDRLAKNPTGHVLIVEGEKTCLAAMKIGMKAYVPMTWSGGSKAVGKTDWTPLEGRSVLLWPDADAPGYEAMAKVAAEIQPFVKEIKIIDVKDQPEGWDAADAGFTSHKEFLEWARPRVTIFQPPAIEPEIDEAQVPISDEELDIEELKQELDADVPMPLSMQQVISVTGLPVSTNGVTPCSVQLIRQVFDRWPAFEGMFWYDEFHKKIFTRMKLAPGQTHREWEEIDTLFMLEWIQLNCGMRRASDDMIRKAIMIEAHRHTTNEPKDWMDTLQWDGTARLDSFFQDYFEAEDNAYTQAISKNFWISMVKRVYQPGTKVDNMIVLEGKQGKFKSTALSIIGGKWFAEATESAISKDFYLLLQGRIIVEIAELDAFSKAETNTIKKVVSQTIDRFRPPYGSKIQDFPRTCVFCGTTNEDDYLRDHTGGRRFWPLKVGRIDLDGLREHREQFFAEAIVRMKMDEPHWEVPPDLAEEMQASRTQVDEWTNLIREWLHGRGMVTLMEVAKGALALQASDLSPPTQRRISISLKRLGYQRSGGGRSSHWKKDGYEPSPDVALPPRQTNPTLFEENE